MINISNLKNKEDLEVIAEAYANYYANSILEEKWTKTSALELFKYFYDKNPDLLFVAYDDNKPVGAIMSLLKPWWDGKHLEDGEVFVCEEYKRQGIAKQLFKTLFTYAIEKYDATVLEAHTYKDENGFPYCWYERLGFETVDDWKIISGDIKKIVHKL
jgi:GNAT superfamily N-acetyltransferase